MSALKDPRWLALSSEARAHLSEKYRDCNVDYGWSGSSIKQFKEDQLEKYGIAVTNVFWSGFWSQGDGACFAGYIHEWKKFLRAVKPDLNDAVIDWVVSERPRLHIRTRGSYCHSGTMWLDWEYIELLPPADYEDCELQMSLWRTLTHDGDILGHIERELLDFVRDEADKFYKELEQEYDYLTSDEAVVETLLANHEDLDSLVADHDLVS